jgi:hypothetical protein
MAHLRGTTSGNDRLRTRVQGLSWAASRVSDATDQSTRVGWPCENRSVHGAR